MSEFRDLNQTEMETLFREARESKAPVSVRAVGSVRLLGDLHIGGCEAGTALHLNGARRRDQLPPKGTPLALSVVLKDEIFSLHSSMLAPILCGDSDTLYPPVLCIEWPQARVEVHQRGDVRVATMDLPPLEASLEFKDRVYGAKLLNLTETGLGMGLTEQIFIDLHAQVEVETELPGGIRLRTTGKVCHLEWLDEDPLPTRIGLVLGCMTDQTREALRSFIQARRTDRSEHMRNEH